MGLQFLEPFIPGAFQEFSHFIVCLRCIVFEVKITVNLKEKWAPAFEKLTDELILTFPVSYMFSILIARC